MDLTAISRLPPSTIETKQHRIPDYFLIWLDDKIDLANKDYQNTLAKLHDIINDVNIFTQPDECVDFLTDLDDRKAFLIIASAMSQHLVPLIHDIAHLDSIYIFYPNNAQHPEFANEWSKIEGFFNEIERMCNSLEAVVRIHDHNGIPMSFVPEHMLTSATKGHKNLDELEPSYMYSILFKEILLEINEHDENSIEYLIVYCRRQSVSEYQLNNFKHEYHEKTPIWWYTRQIFLYGMFNKALRSLDMEAMMKMGFFICNLHRQLDQLHKNQLTMYTEMFIVYRGQGLSQQAFEHLRKSKDGLLSFNNFLSTSKEKRVAMRFIQDALRRDASNVGILFIMTIDPSKMSSSSTPFALIDEYSAFSQEQEILFSMHTIFRVNEITQTVDNTRLWEVQLTLTNDNDPQLAALTKYIQKEIVGTGWYRMGCLLLKVGHFNQAEELYNELVKNASSDTDREYIYHQLAEVKMKQGQFKESRIFYEKSLKTYRKTLPEDHPLLAHVYNNIGELYSNVQNYSKALEFYEKAHKIKEKTLDPRDPSLAISYHNIGSVYDYMGDNSKAIEFYENAYKINEQVLPSNHPRLAISCGVIGQVYEKLDEYSKALEHYKKTLKIHQKTLPSNHPYLVTSYSNIGLTYDKIGDYPSALQYFEKAHKINEKILPSNHPLLATSFNNIGLAYRNMNDYSKALEYFEKAHRIKENIWSPLHPKLALSYNNIAAVYDDMGNNSKALEFYERANKIYEQAVPSNHTSLAISYWNLGSVYEKTDDYAKALPYLEKALNIFQKSLPPTHPHVKTVLNTIDNIKKKL